MLAHANVYSLTLIYWIRALSPVFHTTVVSFFSFAAFSYQIHLSRLNMCVCVFSAGYAGMMVLSASYSKSSQILEQLQEHFFFFIPHRIFITILYIYIYF